MERPNVLFLLVDTLRSDKSVVPEQSSRLPNIHSMVTRGTTFTDMISVNSYTVPCVSSIFTGLYPTKHMVRGMLSGKIPPWTSTLAEVFKASGYNTYASVAGPLEEWVGFKRGFDYYKMRSEDDDHLYSGWKDKFLDMIKNKFKAPWFTYIHFWEVHQPRQLLPEHNHPEFGKTLYERALVSWDTALKDILDVLPDDTLVILTGDHGEIIAESRMGHFIDRYKNPIRNFLKKLGVKEGMIKNITKKRANLMRFLHNKGAVNNKMATMIGHGYHVYEPLIRVPFVMMNESLVPKYKVIDKQVTQVDIFPTLVDLLGLNSPKHTFCGQSLMPLLRGEPWKEKSAFIEAGSLKSGDRLEESSIGAVRKDGWKYACGINDEDFNEELYNLLDDPMEKINLASIELGKKTELKGLIEDHFSSENEGQMDKGDLKMTDEERSAFEDKLKDLGYM